MPVVFEQASRAAPLQPGFYCEASLFFVALPQLDHLDLYTVK